MRKTPLHGLTPTLSALALLIVLATPASPQGSGSTRINPPSPRPAPPATAPVQPAPIYRPPAPAVIQPRPAPAPAPAPVRPQTAEEFHLKLWRYLVRPREPYTSWKAPAGKEGLRKVDGPHGPLVRTYANPAASWNMAEPPYESIIILEDYAEDGKTRTGINVMYRVKNIDPAHQDWYWMKYNANGTVARTPAAEGNAAIAGRVASCIACHQKAGGKDLLFSNDPAAPEAEK